MDFKTLENEILSIIDGEPNLVANLANISSSIFYGFLDLNWCGFYLWSEEDQELILGPFQGRSACLRIKPGKGVCGGSYEQRRSFRVEDVHAFPGHIACDSASESELVLPMIYEGKVWGVLDLDSPKLARFSVEDEKAFMAITQKFTEKLGRLGCFH
jgi:L-methionine (R)-S-oxide reductase